MSAKRAAKAAVQAKPTKPKPAKRPVCSEHIKTVLSSDIPKVHLVDASDWIYRSYFAAPRFLSNKHGTPSGAVLLFCKQIVSLANTMRPGVDHIAITFDSGKTWRNAISPEYKAGRPERPQDFHTQLAACQEGASAILGEDCCFQMSGVEADDIIAEIAEAYKESTDYAVVIHSRDQDMFQLVRNDPNLFVCVPGKVPTWVDVGIVKDMYNLQPSQLPDMWALSGQSADNLKGVPGIGPKRAKELIEAFGSLACLFSPNGKKIADKTGLESARDLCIKHKDTVLLSERIMRLPAQTDPSIARFGPPPPELYVYRGLQTNAIPFLDFWGLRSIKKFVETPEPLTSLLQAA